MSNITRYHHRPGYDTFDREVLCSDGLRAHLETIVERAAEIARDTAKEDTGEWKDSFYVGTSISQGERGSRVVGFLASTDPDATAKEFGYGSTFTMNDAMSQASQSFRDDL